MERSTQSRKKQKITSILLSTLILTVTELPKLTAFIAYECSGLRLNIISFNSLTVEFCTPPTPTKTTPIHSIKLIQKSDIQPIHYRSCYITVDYLVTRCSAFEDAQVVDGGFQTEIELGYIKCASLHERLVYDLTTGGSIDNLAINRTTLADRILAGYIDSSGNCDGVSIDVDSFIKYNEI